MRLLRRGGHTEKIGLYLLALPLPTTRCPSEYTLSRSASPWQPLWKCNSSLTIGAKENIDQKERASELSQLCGLAINLDC